MFSHKGTDSRSWTLRAAKLVAAALVRGETITIYTDAAVEGAVPDEVRLAGLEAFADYHGGGAMLISPRKPELTDKPEVLWLVPQTVYLGIGLKAGKPEEAVAQAVEACLAQAGVDPAALAGAASIDIKREEAGLLRFAAGEASAAAVLYRGGAEPSGRKFYGIGFCQADHRDR